MNNKGFTLIEILAVVVILAAIMLLITPKVLNVFSNTKQKAYNEQMELIEIATKKYMAENSYDIVWVANEATITFADIISKGYIKGDIKNPKNGSIFCDISYVLVFQNGKQFSYDFYVDDNNDGTCSITP